MTYTIIRSREAYLDIKGFLDSLKIRIQTIGLNVDDILSFPRENNRSMRSKKKTWRKVFKELGGNMYRVGYVRLVYMGGQVLLLDDYQTNPYFINHLLTNYKRVSNSDFRVSSRTIPGTIRSKTRLLKRTENAPKVDTYNIRFLRKYTEFNTEYDLFNFIDQTIVHPQVKLNTSCLEIMYSNLGTKDCYMRENDSFTKINPQASAKLVLARVNAKGALKGFIRYSDKDQIRRTRASVSGHYYHGVSDIMAKAANPTLLKQKT